MALDDPMEVRGAGLSPGANLSNGSGWLPMIANPLSPVLIQSNQPTSIGSRMGNQGRLTSELDQLRPAGEWLSGPGGMSLSPSQAFQGGDSGLGDLGEWDDLWHLDDFDPNFWPGGIGFNFADDLYGVASSVESFAGHFAHESPQLEPAPALDGHPNVQNAMGMVQHYFEQISRPSSPGHEKPKHRWFSEPPRLQIYDEEVMEVFVKIARHHLIQTFPVLADLPLAREPRKEFHLACAAVGGLFCNVPGRFKVVNSMYNDARRMLLALTYQEDFIGLEDKLSAAKTFILLEIYGLCSGDKRSYEFVEAFHARMLSAVEEYRRALAMEDSPSDTFVQESRALTVSLYVLECYRVILMLRPPIFHTGSDFEIRHRASPSSSAPGINDIVTDLFTPGRSARLSHQEQDSVIALSTICITAWPVFARGLTTPQRHTLWKPEFIELALNGWAQTQAQGVNWSTLLLYHLIHINLHSNMFLIQRFAHSPAESPFRATPGKAFACIKQWQQDRHYPIAKWHAQSILRRVKDATAASGRRPPDTLGDVTSGGIGRPLVLPEGPHLPYCVYLAGLILWCGSTVSAEERTLNAPSIDTCSQLLSGFKVRVAELLDGIFRELKT
ncbi:hypothetical protein MMC13_000202 [Lambiella insularis]|nr:hypothetical protein [Lambiella insularis]